MKTNETLAETLAQEGFITVAEAAGLLRGVRPATVWSWVKTAKVAHRRVGRRLFVRRLDVERMLGIQRGGAG